MTTDVTAYFEENGFFHAKSVFRPDEVAALETDFDRIVRQLVASGEDVDATWDGGEAAKIAKADDRILHTHNVQKYSRVWLNAFLNERFLDVVERLIGPDIILHHSKLFQKPAEAGSPFPMHQDWPYFPTVNDSMIAGIIHVSRATDEMGCLRVYPGSHLLGRVEGADGRRQNDLLDQYPIENAAIVEAEPGDVQPFGIRPKLDHLLADRLLRGPPKPRPVVESSQVQHVEMHCGALIFVRKSYAA